MALIGHAEREGYNITSSVLHSLEGAECLLAHLHSRFGGSRLDDKHTTIQEIHSCQCGQALMEDYLTRLDSAVRACERADFGVTQELLALQVLQQANLTQDQATVVMLTVKSDALNRGVVTYQEMQASLTLLHRQRAKARAGTGSVASVTLTVAEHRALVAAAGRTQPGSTPLNTGDSSKAKCWHCKEVGHLRRNCPARVRQPSGGEGPADAPNEERALITSCQVRSALVCVSDCVTGQAVIDPGATATVAGQNRVRAYKAALKPIERETLLTEVADVFFRC